MELDTSPLCFWDARRLAAALAAGEVSAVEAIHEFLEQIARVNPKVNAIVTLRQAEQLIAEARAADTARARGEALGPLHGLPLAIKDLADTKGIRTTYGSPIFADHVPDADEIFVERLKQAGAIIIGKTNTPEFGAGSQTFNPVFGATRNPYDLARTCGGSSGGAAVATACGMVPFADGTDLGGSLRNPPSFCNVVGFRPSAGRVPQRQLWAWDTLSVVGPIARNVPDLAMLLAVMAGPDDRDPISLDEPGRVFLDSLVGDFRGRRIAWSRNLGRYPVEPVVNEICDAARPVFSDLGLDVDDREPDFSGADAAFQTLRAAHFAHAHGDKLEHHRDLIKDTVAWNTEIGLKLSARDVMRAEATRTELYRRMDAFLNAYDFLILPVSQVVPFPIDTEWVTEINGVPMETYIDWMATCYAITCTGLPAISVPCGFTPDGLPVGLQIVGKRHRDMDVLMLAHAFESVTQLERRRPPIAG